MALIPRLDLALLALWALIACTPAAAPTAPSALPPGTPTPALAASPTSSPSASTTLTVPSVVLGGHTAGVTELAWSPDGALLASAARYEADHSVRLWNADGIPMATLSGHTGPVLALAWSPDGATLASGAADGTVRFWNRSGSFVRTLSPGAGEVWALAWSPDGSMLATGSMTGTLNPTVQIWHADGPLIAAVGTQFTGGKYYNLLWSPDGQRLLGGAIDYKVWKSDGSEITHLTSCAHCTPSWAAGWSPDSRSFALGDENGYLSIYDRDGNLLEGHQRNDNINTLAFSRDGKLLAAGREVWLTDGTYLTGVNGRIISLAWSFDSQYLAAAADKLITIVRAEGTRATVLRDHTGTVNRVAWSPSGSILASASDDMTVRLWTLP